MTDSGGPNLREAEGRRRHHLGRRQFMREAPGMPPFFIPQILFFLRYPIIFQQEAFPDPVL